MNPFPDTTSEINGKPILETKGICKAFGHVQALDRVDMQFFPGEVLALVGDNGAGKSTLVKILSGVYEADAGEVYIDGERVDIRDPLDAQRYGIATVYQDLALVETRDVATNVYLGQEPKWMGFFVNYGKMQADAIAVLSALNIDIPSVKVYARDLSGGQRQAVAVARALARGKSIFLLDEPTAALGIEQSATLNDLIMDLKAQRKTILVITHNLEHVFQIADRLVVLRRGKRVGGRKKEDTSREEIIGLITGAIRGDAN